MEEKTYLSESSVTVTNARFIVPRQTYAMTGITSVKEVTISPRRIWPAITALIGIVFLSSIPLFGVVLCVVAALWMWRQKTEYQVVVTTAGGEQTAFGSTDREFVGRIVEALNKGFVDRSSKITE